ncbi:MAG: DUF2272 domain-containing protein [Pseudomonadota bacterium]|nr:DUF2272 domain-containing protein [Pseudomonadota bacterium]
MAIALREWRLFGQPIDDEPPDARPPPLPDQKPERAPGLWQRVGEYWWLGMDAGTPKAAWTGEMDEQGVTFPASDDASYAWSAAFISYVMRIAGAGPHFPYSAAHADYINIAKQQKLGQVSGWLVTAERPSDYAPQPGDLICMSRGPGRAVTYDDLPDGHFPAHCDIVVTAAPGVISVIGGNVDDAVTLKHVPVTGDGKLAGPNGRVLDRRYAWMVVLHVLYPEPPAVPVSCPARSVYFRGGSQAFVAIWAGTDTSRMSNLSAVRVSLCGAPPGI